MRFIIADCLPAFFDAIRDGKDKTVSTRETTRCLIGHPMAGNAVSFKSWDMEAEMRTLLISMRMQQGRKKLQRDQQDKQS